MKEDENWKYFNIKGINENKHNKVKFLADSAKVGNISNDMQKMERTLFLGVGGAKDMAGSRAEVLVEADF
jgi:hypothetical protein